MSRYYVELEQFEQDGEPVEAHVAYGFDWVAGYFYQVWAGEGNEPVEDTDSMRGLSRSGFIERMDALCAAWPDEHRQAVALDMPF